MFIKPFYKEKALPETSCACMVIIWQPKKKIRLKNRYRNNENINGRDRKLTLNSIHTNYTDIGLLEQE